MLGGRKNRNDDVLRTFQKVLPGKSLEEINDIVRNPPVTLGEIGQVQVHFLLAQARDDEALRVTEITCAIARVLNEFGGSITALVPPLLVSVFGAPLNPEGEDARRAKAAALAMTERLGSDVKVVYGTETGLCGLMELPRGAFFAPVLPNMRSHLEKLLSASPGTAVDVSELCGQTQGPTAKP
jgi:hypothetical protein